VRKRRLWIAGSIVLLLIGIGLARFYSYPGRNITKENVEKVDFGMTERQIEAILGVPAGDYSGLDWEKRMLRDTRLEALPPGHTRKYWVGYTDGIVVVLNEQGVVCRGRDFNGINIYRNLRLLPWELIRLRFGL
jgi:hypothetical protein